MDVLCTYVRVFYLRCTDVSSFCGSGLPTILVHKKDKRPRTTFFQSLCRKVIELPKEWRILQIDTVGFVLKASKVIMAQEMKADIIGTELWT